MISKFKRTNFYKQETINNKLEYDLIKNYWDLFKIKRPLKYISITKEHIQRPDILSYSIYGDVNYWWIISKFNLIDDWWNDLQIGNNISVPDKKDIDDFFLQVYINKK